MSPGPNGGPGTPGSIMQPSPQSMDGSASTPGAATTGGTAGASVQNSQNGPPNPNDPFSVMQRGILQIFQVKRKF